MTRFSPNLPRVGSDEFQAIVEGNPMHPNLMQLKEIADLPSNATVTSQQAQTRDHLRDCAQCTGLYKEMKTV